MGRGDGQKMWRAVWVLLASVVSLLAGCHAEHHQSMLHPASSPARQIAWLWWFLLAICSFVFVVVLVLTWLAIRPYQHGDPASAADDADHDPHSTALQVPTAELGDRFILWLGAIIPGGILFVILLVSVGTQKSLGQPETDLTIQVVGHQFWWEVHYPEQDFEIANEIRIPVGVPVRLELISADVTHSLWIPNLQGKTDLLPDRVNVTWLQADQPGVFRGQCAEYCGVQHAMMALHVVAVPREEFEDWLAQRQRPYESPTESLAQRGRDVFIKANCNNCHTVGDDRAARKRGPDLTHFGDRRTVGAGILPNNRGNLSGWISNPQAIKPGNLMPRTHLEADDLHALIEFLENLK